MFPRVFVSSTCYDLGQVRADIKSFIEGLGFEAVLSEYSSFPIDPNTGTIDNCLKNVDNFADIFVLIVGGRYGYQDENGKSVTNLEYLRARAKNIPIYIFIDKKVQSIMPVWRDNPNSDFKSVVQTTKIFEFIDYITTTNNAWVHSFEHAQDITETLKKQFAHLFSDTLSLRQRLNGNDDFLKQLRGEELKLILEKPTAWEYRLFSQIVVKGICNASNLRRDVKYNIILGRGDKLNNILEVQDWVISETQVLLRLASSLTTLFNVTLQEAVGLPGEPGNPEYIIYVAEKFVEAYKSTLEWTIHVRKVSVPQDCRKLILIIADFCKNIIDEIEQFSEHMSIQLSNAVKQYELNRQPLTLELNLKITAPDMSEYYKEVEQLTKNYSLR